MSVISYMVAYSLVDPLYITVGICRQNPDYAHIDKHSGAIPIIVARN